jgi:chloramphenicol 3-O phosphotransferase
VLFRQTGSVTVPGQIVILNGVPRSGKSAIASAAQEIFSGLWVNLGVDASMRSIPERLRPGIGLRPGGERPDLEDTVLLLYAALYESIAAHARLGVNVVTDVGHHESYSKPLRILPDCAMRLSGFPVLWVGVRCPIDVIWQRREESWGQSFDEAKHDLRNAVERWQR